MSGGRSRDLWAFVPLGACVLVCVVRLPFVEEKGRLFLLYALAIATAATGFHAWTVYRRQSGMEGPPE
jgi:hypothetical protein